MTINRTASKYLLGAAFAGLMLISSGVTQADTVNCAEPGDFQSLNPGTVYCGNDPFSGKDKGFINGSPSLVKWEPGKDNEEGVAAGTYADNISVTVDAAGTSGTWSWINVVAGELFPKYVVYKANGGFLLSLVTSLTNVPWTTLGLLDGHEISHISWYNHGTRPPGGIDPVPVPAALPLLLSALGGLTWLSRRRRANRAV